MAHKSTVTNALQS